MLAYNDLLYMHYKLQVDYDKVFGFFSISRVISSNYFLFES